MERLTQLDSKGNYYIHDQSIPYNEQRYGKEVDRLAAYEDTGLTPEEVRAMNELFEYINEDCQSLPKAVKRFQWLKNLINAEKDGQLVVLPCKVGDTVYTNFAMSGWYFRSKDKPYSARVVFIGLNGSDAMGKGLINVVYGKHDYMTQFPLSDIGKTVFLTREEAEAALRRKRVDNDTTRKG